MKKRNIISLAAILALFAQTAGASQFQSHESIEAAARHYLETKLDHLTNFHITIDPLDRRLKLPKCNKPLQAFTHTDNIRYGRVSIGIRCTAGHTWTIYHSAHITVYRKIITLKHPLQRGDIITRDHLALEKKELSKIRHGFFTDYQHIVNQQATRDLMTGTVITPTHLTTPKLIKRGEKVVISAKTKRIDIQMTGSALADGVKGQRIRVRNDHSQRIIEATVIQPGLVSVGF